MVTQTSFDTDCMNSDPDIDVFNTARNIDDVYDDDVNDDEEEDLPHAHLPKSFR